MPDKPELITSLHTKFSQDHHQDLILAVRKPILHSCILSCCGSGFWAAGGRGESGLADPVLPPSLLSVVSHCKIAGHGKDQSRLVSLSFLIKLSHF